MIRHVADRSLLVSAALAIALAGCRPGGAPARSPAPSPGEGQPTAAARMSTPLPGSPTPDAGRSPTSPPTAGTPAPTDDTPAPPDGSPPPIADPSLGIGWQLVDAPLFTSADGVADAAAVGSLVVAVGSSYDDSGAGRAAAWYSLDGYDWQPADSLTGAENASIDAVAAGGSGLVAVGFDYSEEMLLPAAWHSADGRSWTRVTDAELARGQMAAVTATFDGYLALGADFDDGTALAWTSADGIDWSAAAIVEGLGAEAAINGLVAAGPRLIAFGSSDGAAQAWHSADGLAWQPAEGLTGGSDSGVNDVALGASGLVAVGAEYLDEATRTLVWTSPDGTSWQSQPVDLDGEMIGVEALGSGYLAVGTLPEANELVFAAAAWTSSDGATWQTLPEEASFDFARMFELVPAAPGVVVIGEKSLDAAGEEMAPAIWIGVTQQESQR